MLYLFFDVKYVSMPKGISIVSNSHQRIEPNKYSIPITETKEDKNLK